MLFLVDPSRVALDGAGWFFLVVVCVLLPLGALRQHRALAGSSERPSRSRIYASAIATHVVFLLMVWAVAHMARLSFFPPYHLTPLHLLIGLIALAIGLLPILERFRIQDSVAEERTRLIAPRTGREFPFFYLLCVTAGIAEELTYRGLLFTLLTVVVGGWWGAAIVSASAFGIVHLFQGWKAVGIATLMGLREQIVVGLTGTLLIAIVVHALHDAVAGTVIGLRAQHEESVTGGEAAAENVTNAEGVAENTPTAVEKA